MYKYSGELCRSTGLVWWPVPLLSIEISLIEHCRGDIGNVKLVKNSIKKVLLWLTNLGLEIEINREYASNCINLYGNPIETPPLEVAKQGNESIRNYYRQLEAQGKDYLYEAKMLIVGEDESGKNVHEKQHS